MSRSTACRMQLQRVVCQSVRAWTPRVALVRPFMTLLAFLAVVPISTTRAQTADTDAIPTLDDIIIEGELVVPQVLFITARDQYRYDDYMYTAYLSTSLGLAQDAVMPMWLGLAPVPLAVRVTDHEPEQEQAQEAPTDTHDADASRTKK